jgi:integrase
MKELATLSKRKLKNGKEVYRIRWWENGKRRSETLGHCDRRRAERVLAEKARELESNAFVEPVPFSSFINMSLEMTRSQIRPSSTRLISQAGQRLVEIVGDKPISRITFSDAESFARYCAELGNRPATINRHIRSLKRLWNLAIRRGLTDDNPWRHIRQRKVAAQDWHWFTADELGRMTSASPDLYWHARIMAAFTAGLRRGEISNLTWRDLDFENLSIEISPKEPSDEVWGWQPKDTDRRIVPLTDELARILVTLQASQPDGHPYVAVPPERYRHIQRCRQLSQWGWPQEVLNNFARDFRRIVRAANVFDRATFHDLRRSAISNWLDRGVRPHEVRQLAGHASIQTTERYYVKVAKSAVDRARDASSQGLVRPDQTPSGPIELFQDRDC